MKRPNPGRGRRPLSAQRRRSRPTLGDTRALRAVPEALEARELLAQVTLGKVVTATEGFGYGSTIDGFGSSLDLGQFGSNTTTALTNPFGVSQTRAFTQELWLFPKASASGLVYQTQNASGALTSIGVQSGRDLVVSGGFPGGSFTIQGALNAGAWNHLAQTFDGATYRVFVNGVERLNSKAFAGQAVPEPTSLRVGVTAGQPGVLDELRFWNVARTPAQIQKGLTEFPARGEAGLVGYYKFDGDFSDASGRNGPLAGASGAAYVNNPAPQVGYVEVKVDAPVATGIGLFVGYQFVAGGTLTENVDFLSSKFRTVSTDAGSERLGIIIPEKETTGRIYFIARPDAVAEPTESIQLQLTPFTFSTSSYSVGASNTATFSIADNGAYRAGVAAYSGSGRFLTRDNQAGRPLYVANGTGRSDLQIALTSQPAGSVSFLVDSGPNANFLVNNQVVDSVTMTFDPNNWDAKQKVTVLSAAQPGTTGNVVVTQNSGGYIASPVSIPYTTTPPSEAEVEEGNAEQGTPLVPQAQVVPIRDAREADQTGGAFQVLLNAPAPAGGLTIKYGSTIGGQTTVKSFSGADAGEGLDLDGTFVYALSYGGSAAGLIRDANFTTDAVAGVTTTNSGFTGLYYSPNVGLSTNDTRMNSVLSTVRSSIAPTPLVSTLGNLVPGVQYKLQLVFGDNVANRGFDVLANGVKIVDDLNIASVQGGATVTSRGAVVTYTFVATTSTMEIRLDSAGAPFSNTNPIISGLTLERLANVSIVQPSGSLFIPEGARSGQIPFVIFDDPIVNGPRSASVQLVAGTGYTLGATTAGSINVADDDKASVNFSNFALADRPAPSEEPNESRDGAYNLGLLVPGKTTFQGSLSSADDLDYFRFRIDTTRYQYEKLVITADNNKDFALVLYSGTSATNFDRAGNTEVVFLSTLNSGTYDLWLQNKYQSGTYTISVTGYDLEPRNNTLAGADDLGVADLGPATAGQVVGSDVDFYKFTYNDALANLTSVRIEVDTPNQPMSLVLQDAKGNNLASTSTLVTETGVSYYSIPIGAAVGRGSGVYYLRVSGATTSVFNNYKVSFAGSANASTFGVFADSYAPLSLRESAGTPVSEGFGVRLNSQPASDVVFTFTATSTGATTAAGLSTTSLRFTPTNWNVYQLVNVTPLDDLLADGDQVFTITGAAVSDDPNYAGRVGQITAVIGDDEPFAPPAEQPLPRATNAPRAFVSSATASAAEGGSMTFNVRLSASQTVPIYLGIGLDDNTARQGADFALASFTVQDYRPVGNTLTSLILPTGANAPAFADLDGDGDLDLILGTDAGGFQFYRNVGTASQPKFALQRGADDPFAFLGAETLGGYLHPTFLDADFDGDLDMAVGTKTGLAYFRNTGTAKAPGFARVTDASNPFASLATVAGGSNFAPTATDLDGDGDRDLLVTYQGGTKAAYFLADKVAKTIARSDASSPLRFVDFPANEARTVGFADLDRDGDLDLLIGTPTGTIVAMNGNTATSPSFGNLDANARFSNVASGINAPSWTAADLDGDGLAEVYGGSSGKLSGFSPYRAIVFQPGETSKVVQVNALDNLIDEPENRTFGYRILDSKDYIINNASFVDANDLNGNGNRTETIRVPFSGVGTIVDNDVAGINVTTPTGLGVTEAGGAQTFGVSLRTQPTSNVTVYVASSDPSEGVVAGATGAGAAKVALTFTPANWNVAQAVRVIGVDDQFADGARSFQVRAESQGDDVPYRGLASNPFVFTNADNEVSGITVTGPQATLAGKGYVYSVVLKAKPVGSVRITATPSNDQIQLDGGNPGDPSTLVFSQANWNIPQLVRISAGDDGLIEGFHSSRIAFTVETGRPVSGTTSADISTPANAYDLGDIAEGLAWRSFPFARIADAGAGWFKFKINRMGSGADVLQTTGFSAALPDAPRITLFDKAGATALRTSTRATLSGAAYLEQLSLDKLAPGEYTFRLTASATTAPTFTLRVDNADVALRNVALAPIDVSIKDNDLPIARITPGPAASEVFSQPSYFAVKLNVPTSASPGDTGTRVYFKVSGGRATPADSGSNLADYRVVADGYDPISRVGFVRVAPGNLQANIGIIPIDDKAVEDLPITLGGFIASATGGFFTATVDAARIAPIGSSQTSYVLAAGAAIKANVNGRDIVLTLNADANLTRPSGGATYSGTIDARASAVDVAFVPRTGTFRGAVASEDVEVTLLPGADYLLPLAPEKQGLNISSPSVQSNSANLDQAKTVARLLIADDDVPGVRIVRLGDDTPLAEGGKSATYGVSLLAEPLQPVTVTITPDGQVFFENAASRGTANVRGKAYTLATAVANLDLALDGVVKTDQGWSAVLHARPKTVTLNGSPVVVSVADGFASTPSDTATFTVPAAGQVDAAGQPVQGNWREYQRLVATGLTEQGDANGVYFNLRVKVGTAETTVRINVSDAATPTAVTTASFTFQPSNWFQFQNFQLAAAPDALAEPGDYHEATIRASLVSTDPSWNDVVGPPTVVKVSDQQIKSGDAAQAFSTGIDTLRNSLEGVELPLVGDLTEFAPAVEDFFDQIEEPIDAALEGETETTGDKLNRIIESALSGVTVGGVPLSDVLTVTVMADADQVTIEMAIQKHWDLFNLDLSGDFGLAGLGLDVRTTGSIGASIDLSFRLTVGLSRTYGVFIDTENTGIDIGAKLNLTNFGAEGNLGFLRLNLNDDPNNPTGLSATFHAGLNDLDNDRTVKFLDANGDGLLSTADFVYGVGVDANGDGRIDTDTDGLAKVAYKTVREPWTNVSAAGVEDAFPTVAQANSLFPGSGNLNFRSNVTFDEALDARKDGVYRVKRRGALTLYYLDANGDGQLNIGKRGVDPFTAAWSALTAAEKNKSEIWIVAANNTRWVDASGSVREFQIQTTGSGATLKFFFDANGNNALDANEEISAVLRKKLDKDKSGKLEADVHKDGEGTFLQGTGIAFEDTNGNGKLDAGERFVNASFDPLSIPEELLAFDAGNNTFLDLNGDGAYNDGVDVLIKTNAAGTRYIDSNLNNIADAFEIQGNPGSTLQAPVGEGSYLTYSILTSGTTRYMDINNDKVFDAATDINVNAASSLISNRVAGTYWNIAKAAGTITFYDADGNRKLSDRDFQVITVEAERFIDLDRDGLLTTANGEPVEPVAGQNNTFDESGFIDKTKIVRLVNDGDRLTLRELLNFRKQVRADNTTLTDQLKASLDLFTYSFTGDANLGLHAVTSFGGDAAFPSFSFDLAINFPLFNFGDQSEAADNGFSVEFNQVTLDLGTYLTEFAGPILDTVDELLTPIKPLVKFLNADIKLPSYLGLAGAFEYDNRAGTSLLEVARVFAKGDPKLLNSIDQAIKYSGVLSSIIDTVSAFKQTLGSGDNGQINFGDFSLSDLRAASDDEADSIGRSRKTKRADGATPAQLNTRSGTAAPAPLTGAAAAAAQSSMVATTQGKSNLFKKLGQLDGFTFDLFNPDTALAILMGESGVNIATYDVPDFSFNAGVTQKFKIWGPLSGLFEGNFSVSTDISVGFDTAGFEAWAAADYAPDQVYKVFDGFYLNDWDAAGNDKNELTIGASVAVGAGIDIGIASGFVKGGVRGTIGLDIVDQGEYAGTSDGRIRGSDIVAAFKSNPLDLFELNGTVEAFLGAKVEVDFFFFSATVYDNNFATFKLADFKLSTAGFSGSSDSGKVQGGPIQGATVWLDANNNGQLDSGEPTTTTDVAGNYNLLIPDGYDQGAGIIRVEGGTDVTTGTPQGSAFSKQVGQNLITPLTTLADQLTQVAIPSRFIDYNQDGKIDQGDVNAFLAAYNAGSLVADQNRDGIVNDVDASGFSLLYEIDASGGMPNLDQANRLILFSLGLDPNLELGSLQHFDLALVNDPRARTLLFRVDATEALVDSIESWFEGAAGLRKLDPITAPIITDVIYRSFAQQIADGSLDITKPAVVKAIILRAIPWANDALARAGVANRLDIDELLDRVDAVAAVIASTTLKMQILAARASDGVQLAAFITKAKLVNERDTDADLYLHGQGELDDATLIARNGAVDEAAIARIVATLLPPQFSKIDDIEISEDASDLDRPFTVIDFNGVGTPTFSFSSTNNALLPVSAIRVVPGDLPGQWLLSLTPTLHGSGQSVVTLTYTDAAGQSASISFRLVVDPIRHSPVAVADAFTAFDGKSIRFDVLANDSDPDQEPLTATITSAPLHGTLVRNADGTFTFTPEPGFIGRETLQYVVDDGRGGSAVGTLTLISRPTNFTPVASADAASLNEDGTITVRVLANDTDADGDALSLVSVGQGTKGSVRLNADGTVTYTPRADANGTDTFTYTITDRKGNTAVGRVTVTIAAVNDAPTSPGKALTTRQGTSASFNPLAGAADVDGDTLGVASFTQGLRGSVRRNADGTLTYTPAGEFRGTDRFTYTLSDGKGGTRIVPVAVTVTPAPPTVVSVAPAATKKASNQLVVKFSNDLEPARAIDLTSFTLTSAGADGFIGTADDVTVRIKGATYDAATRSVTLTLGRRLNLKKRFAFKVSNSNPIGKEGLKLDGDKDGQEGGTSTTLLGTPKIRAGRGR